MATSYFRTTTQARVDVSALVVPFVIEPADIVVEPDYDYPSLEVSILAVATEMARIVPFRIAEVPRIDVSAPVIPLTNDIIEGTMLIDYDYPAFEFETSTIVYPDVDLIEFDFPSFEMELETDEISRRRAKLMIVQVL